MLPSQSAASNPLDLASEKTNEKLNDDESPSDSKDTSKDYMRSMDQSQLMAI